MKKIALLFCSAVVLLSAVSAAKKNAAGNVFENDFGSQRADDRFGNDERRKNHRHRLFEKS